MKALLVGLLASILVACAPLPQDTQISVLRQATYGLTHEMAVPEEGVVYDQVVCTVVHIRPEVVLTAAHCAGEKMKVDGKAATIVKKDDTADLMLLFVPGLKGVYIPLATERPALDTPVVTIGYPMGLGEIVTEGRLQGDLELPEAVLEQMPRLAHYMIVTSPVAPGNSGGPVFAKNRFGQYEVVGIVSAVGVTALGGFIPNIITHVAFIVNTETVREFAL